MLKTFIKQVIRKATWGVNKKTIFQILSLRCRQEDKAENGRFTLKEIKQIILQAELNAKELIPYFTDYDNLGNYLMEYGGLLDLAIYRALIKENVARNYAMKLVGDMIWQARLNGNGGIPIIYPLRRMWARLTTKDPVDFLGRYIREAMKFPYSEPGYKVKFYKEKDGYRTDFYSCPVYDFYKQFGGEEVSLFRKTWCTLDYAVAENLVEGGKYQRRHTLSDGDEVCDMRWYIER